MVVGIIALVAVIGYFAWQMEKKRREAFRSWAAEHGWSYSHAKDRSIYHRFDFLDKLNQGSNRYAAHVVQGDWKGRDSIGFSFHWVALLSGFCPLRALFALVVFHFRFGFGRLSFHSSAFALVLGVVIMRSWTYGYGHTSAGAHSCLLKSEPVSLSISSSK